MDASGRRSGSTSTTLEVRSAVHHAHESAASANDRAEPICNASHSAPNPEEAFPNSIPAISEIIERQLVGSFTGKDNFGYICDNLAFLQIDQFSLTNDNLFQAVCDQAGKQVPPRPVGPSAGHIIGEAARFAARNTATILYSTLLAAGAESDIQLNVLCAHAPNYIDNVNAEMLNGTLMASRLCAIKEPLSVEAARSEILSWTSRLFVTVLENIGNVGGWLDWLCDHLDVEGMNSVGLIGWGSKEQVCEDAKTGLPTKIEMPTGIACH